MMIDRRIRLGLYIFTPMLGGAEQYFKDLLWNLNREKFEVVVFCEAWNEFIDFLDLTNCPPVTLCPIKMWEVGGHYGAKELTDTNVPKQLQWWEPIYLRVVDAQKKISFPLLKTPGRLARAVMQYGFLIINSINLFFVFQQRRVDILHVFNGGYPGAQSAQSAGFIAKILGCRITLMSVCNTPVPYHFPKTLERLLDRLVKRFFNILIIPGDYLGKLLIELRDFQLSQFKKIPEGVASPEQYGIVPSAAPHKIHAEQFTIIMVAGFLPHKGHRFLLEALAQLHLTFSNLRIILVGNGPLLEEIRRLTKKIGISQIITFTGSLPLKETLRTIDSADILVHPALMEGMPYVILHAMSLGKPVIATAIGGIPEVVLHEETGLLIPPGDSIALANALRRLLIDKTHIKRMGIEGKKRYTENFGIEIMVKNHTSLYNALLSSI